MLFLSRVGHMSNGQVSKSQTDSSDKSQISQKFVSIIQPDQQLINGDVSPSELAHHNEEEETLPGKEDSPSQLARRVRLNEEDLVRQEQTSKLSADNSHPYKPRTGSRTFCPSPYYYGGGFPSHDYLSGNKTYYYSYREVASPSPSTDKESITTVQTSRSSIVNLFEKVESLSKSCFIMKENEESVPSPSKPEKKVQSKSKLSKRLAGVHIRVGRFLWPPVKKRFGQVRSEKGGRQELSGPSEQFRRKVRSQSLFSYSKQPADSVDRQVEERNAEFLWAEKYRPQRLADFIYNIQQARHLQSLVSQKRCPHIIFEGPPGVGKKSLARAMIREIYENDEPIKQGKLKLNLKGEMAPKIDVPVNFTSNHTEINLSSLRGYERFVIDILAKAERRSNSSEYAVDYKVVVACKADKISTDTQNYIRWLMERNQDSCKFIFCCSNVSKLESISSLCKVIHVQPPTNEQIIQVLKGIANNERLRLTTTMARRIAESSEENLRQAIRSFEACKRYQYPFTDDQKILTGWEDVIAQIAKSIVEEQSPKQLYNIRAKLQKLIIHNLCPNFVFRTLVEDLKQHLDDNLQNKLEDLYAAYNGNMNNEVEDPLTGNQRQSYVVDAKRNSNSYIQIEEFTARFMSVYKAADKEKRHNTEDQNRKK